MGSRLIGNLSSLPRRRMHEIACAGTRAIAVPLRAHGIANEQVGIPRRCTKPLAWQAICTESNRLPAVGYSDRCRWYAMLNPDELDSQSSDLAPLSKLDSVVTHIR